MSACVLCMWMLPYSWIICACLSGSCPLSLGLVLPTYSENHIKANLSDQILQVQCKYSRVYPASFALCLYSSASLSALLCPVWPHALVQPSVPGLQHHHRKCPSGVTRPVLPPLLHSLSALSMLSDRQDHTWVPPTPVLPPSPPVFMLCCKNGDVFSSHWLKKKNNWTDRKVKAVVLLCYSGENNGDLCAIIFFAKCSRLFFHHVMILKRLCSKYLMFWKSVKTRMLFTPYDDFFVSFWEPFPSVVCVIFFVFC